MVNDLRSFELIVVLFFSCTNSRYATSNNIQADESGELRQGGAEGAYLVKRGSYSFTGQDGVTYTINYTADENGFHPEGAHIPKALF